MKPTLSILSPFLCFLQQIFCFRKKPAGHCHHCCMRFQLILHVHEKRAYIRWDFPVEWKKHPSIRYFAILFLLVPSIYASSMLCYVKFAEIPNYDYIHFKTMHAACKSNAIMQYVFVMRVMGAFYHRSHDIHKIWWHSLSCSFSTLTQ